MIFSSIRIWSFAYQSACSLNAQSRELERLEVKLRYVNKLISGEIENDNELQCVKDIVHGLVNGDMDAFLDDEDVVKAQSELRVCLEGKNPYELFLRNHDGDSRSIKCNPVRQFIYESSMNCMIYNFEISKHRTFSRELESRAHYLEHRLKVIFRKKLDANHILDETLKKAKNDVVRTISFEAYCESCPQAILQMYTLWKKPIACFSWSSGSGKYRIYMAQLATHFRNYQFYILI